MQDRIWVTSYGEHIPVSNMSTDHINRCIASIQCERYGKGWRQEYLPRLQLELVIRALSAKGE
jgi:hypothetical protein